MKKTFSYFLTVALMSPITFMYANLSGESKRELKKGAYGIYNKPKEADLPDSYILSCHGEFIYWRAMQDNSYYAISTGMDTTTDGTSLSEVTGMPGAKVHNIHAGWHPGFRIGFGIDFPKANWSLTSRWTQIISYNNGKKDAPVIGGYLYMTKMIPGFNLASFNHAAVTWKCKFDGIDFYASKAFYMLKDWLFEPVLGLKGVIFHQRLRLRSEDTRDATSTETHRNIFTIDNKFDSWGVGPSGGMKSSLTLGRGFYLQGDSFLSLLYQQYDTSLDVDNPNASLFANQTKVLSTKSPSKQENFRPHLSSLVGLGWKSTFHTNKGYQGCVNFLFSYEFQYFWKQNSSLEFVSKVERGIHRNYLGDLGFHGFATKMQFEF